MIEKLAPKIYSQISNNQFVQLATEAFNNTKAPKVYLFKEVEGSTRIKMIEKRKESYLT